MNANQMNTGRGCWLAWFLASILGFGVGALLGIHVAYSLFPGNEFNTAMGITLGIVLGATGGFMQWVVLRERIAGIGLWALASTLGFAAAMGTIGMGGMGENYVMAGILMVVVFGIVGGICAECWGTYTCSPISWTSCSPWTGASRTV